MPPTAGSADALVSANPQHGFDYFEHDADIGVIGRGRRVEDAFEQAASAMFALMVEASAIRPQRRIAVAFDEPDVELALVTWLNALLGEARRHGLVLGRFRLQRDGEHWSGEAAGEPWNASMACGVEVKGATLTALQVSERPGAAEARCVVDV